MQIFLFGGCDSIYNLSSLSLIRRKYEFEPTYSRDP